MRKSLVLLLSGMALFLALPLAGQEGSEHHPQAAGHDFPHHRLAVLIAHTHVPARTQKEGLFIPSWGLDYEFWLHNRLGLGIHSDLELHTFLVEHEEGSEELEREYPLLLTLDLLYRPWKGLVLELGPGYELEKNENLLVFRAGLSYEIGLPGHWDLSPTLFYDSRKEAYDTYTVGLIIGKRF